MTAIASVDVASLSCPICLEQCTIPRSLPACLHTFCTACLHSHIVQITDFNGVRCPVCREYSFVPNHRAPRNKWAEQFPVNHFMQSIQFGDCPQSADEEEPVFCSIHEATKITLYCAGHDRMFCVKCMIASHQSCDHVADIEQKARSSDLSAERQVIQGIITRLGQRAQRGRTELVDAQRQLNDQRDELISTIKRHIGATVSVIRREEKRLISEAGALFENELAGITEEMTKFDKDTAVCIETENMLKSIDRNKKQEAKQSARHKDTSGDQIKQRTLSFIQLQRSKEYILDSISTDGDAHPGSSEKRCFDRIYFELSPGMRAIKVNDAIGKITMGKHQNTKQEESSCSIVADKVYFVKKPSASNKSANKVTAKPIAEERSLSHIETTHYANRTSLITSAISLADQNFILCDHSNSTITIVKEGRKQYDYRSMNCWGLTTLSNEQLFVSCPQENKIAKYEIKCDRRSGKKKLVPCLHDTISVDRVCYGVCYTGTALVAACGDSIQLFTEAGKHLQTLRGADQKSDSFQHVIAVDYCRLLSTLYACDEAQNRVLAFRMKSATVKVPAKFIYTNEYLQKPQSIAVGPAAQIFVTAFGTKTLHVLSSEGHNLRIVRFQQNPSAVAVETRKRLLLVSFCPSKDQNGFYALYSISGGQ